MSFGFSVSDFIAVLKLCKGVSDALKDGPGEYRELQGELKSLRWAIQSLSDDAKDPHSLLSRKGSCRKAELMDVISNCNRTMREMETLIDKHSSLGDASRGKMVRTWDAYRIGSADLDSLRGKLTFHASTISMFLVSLEGSAIARIERQVEKIAARILRDDATSDNQSITTVKSTSSVISQIEEHEEDAWQDLKKELVAENIALIHIMAHRDDIIGYIKSLLVEGAPKIECEQRGQSLEPPSTDERATSSIHPYVFPPMERRNREPTSGADRHIRTRLRQVQHGRYNGVPASMIILNIYLFVKRYNFIKVDCMLGDLDERLEIKAPRVSLVHHAPRKGTFKGLEETRKYRWDGFDVDSFNRVCWDFKSLPTSYNGRRRGLFHRTIGIIVQHYGEPFYMDTQILAFKEAFPKGLRSKIPDITTHQETIKPVPSDVPLSASQLDVYWKDLKL